MTAAQIEAAIAEAGLASRGAIHLGDDERVGPLEGMRSLVLVGFVGRRGWDSFILSAEAQDGLADRLDRWSLRMIGGLAQQLDAAALYPFGSEPFWPFQRWAQRAQPLHPSPLGLLIHPEYGLWHSYRGALAFQEELELTPAPSAPSPCDSCTDKPCLKACPVGAFTPGNYDVTACASWIGSAMGSGCMAGGCLARKACPVGSGYAHQADQAAFGMKAYLAARG